MAAKFKRALSPREIADARSRIAKREHWREVAALYGLTQETLRRQIDPDYRARRITITKNQRLRDYVRKADGIGKERPIAPQIPPRLIAERDARRDAPRTLTSLFCGDPPPGFSALDRRTS